MAEFTYDAPSITGLPGEPMGPVQDPPRGTAYVAPEPEPEPEYIPPDPLPPPPIVPEQEEVYYDQSDSDSAGPELDEGVRRTVRPRVPPVPVHRQPADKR